MIARAVPWVVILSLCITPALLADEVKDPGAQPPEGPGIEFAAAGPDAFGYTAADETEPGGPTFSFIDISATGTQVALGDDTGSGPLPIGFPFDFYGNSFTQVFMSSNGYLTFNNTDVTDFTNDCPVPNGLDPDEAIHVLWDDLNMNTNPGGDGYHQTFASCPNSSGGAGSCAVFMWNDAAFFGGGGNFDFEAVLYNNGNILMQYGPGDPRQGSSSTTGLENVDASDGLTYACNSAGSIVDGRAILFRHPQVAGAGAVPVLSLGGLLIAVASLFLVGVSRFRKRKLGTQV